MIPARSATGPIPYPGLRPFEEGEEHLFFGRERQIDRMIDRLARRRFLAVVGGSGSGKSSLVTCGLQPALRRGLMASAGTAWRMARFRPGLRPLVSLAERLAAALPQPSDEAKATLAAADLSQADVIATQLRFSRLGLVEVAEQAGIGQPTRLLLVVDQFEELFRYRALSDRHAAPAQLASEPGEAQALVNLLLAATAQSACPIHVVLTMRSDFLGDCAQFPGLPEAITASLHLVPRLSRKERRQAIAMPALVGGAEVDPVLLTRLVNDVGDDPDQLSILQHALRRTWLHWQQSGGQGPLSLADYEAIGTMDKALDLHAQQALKALAEVAGGATKEGARSSVGENSDGDGNNGESGDLNRALPCRLFRALTDKASDPRGIRRPTTLANLQRICGGDPAEVERLVNHFRQSDLAFLMPPQEDTLSRDSVVDISHESLIRLWGQLDKWADQEAKDAALFRRLADAARRRVDGKASLWCDPELQEALDWRKREQPTEAWGQRYADNPREAFAFLESSRKDREARRLRILAGLVAFSLGAIGVSLYCWTQWQITRLSRARAYAAIAAATLEQRPLQSMLYSLAALERLAEDPAEALGAFSTLARATLRNWELKRWEINPKGTGRQPISALLALRNGLAISAAGCGQQHGQGDTEVGSCLQLWRGSAAVGPPLPTGQPGDHQEVAVLVELADGRLVSGGTDGTLRLWQREPTLKPLAPPLTAQTATPGAGTESAPESKPAIHSLVQLSDGEIVSGDVEGGLRRWRLVGQGQGSRLEPQGDPVATDVKNIKLLALPNGAWLSGGADPTKEIGGASVRLWRQGRSIGPPLRTGQNVVKQLLLWNEQVLSLGSEGTVVRLNPATGIRQPLTDSDDGIRQPGSAAGGLGRPNVERLAVVDGGRALVSLHSDGTLRLWHVKGSAAASGGVELLSKGQADSKDLPKLEHLHDGRLLAADGNNQMHLIRVPDPRSGELDLAGAVTSGHQAVNALLAVPDDRLVSADQTDGRLCFWELGKRIKRLPVQLRGAGGPCLTGNLGGPGADQSATGVLLAPLQNGSLLSATNLSQTTSSGTAMNSVVLQRWQPATGRRAEDWTVERIATPKSWHTITSLEPAGGAELLALDLEPSGLSTKLWRWNPLQHSTPSRQIRPVGPHGEGIAFSSWRAVPLPGGEWLTASSASGALQRWRAQGPARLWLRETIETGLNSINTLTVLPGDRYALIASGQQTQEEGVVQVFDLREHTWVGQPIPVTRPLGATSGTVAATALAILPEGGLAIGTNTNQANLLVIQPARILEKACQQLIPLLDRSEQQQVSPSPLQRRGIPPAVLQLSRKACKEHLRPALYGS